VQEFLQTFGIWNWLLAGLILVGLELLVPGVFIIWFGCGAVVTALICSLLSPFLPIFGFWQMQILLFSLLSIVFVLIGRRLSRRIESVNEEPLLNKRTDALLGQIATLEEAIENGQGHVRLGDSLWRVSGENLPAGHRVKLLRFHDGAFIVEKVSQ